MKKARPLGLLVLAASLFVLVLGASNARAEFGIAEWEAVTCSSTVETPALGGTLLGLPPAEETSPPRCTKESPTLWFTQATGHPNFGITDFTLNTDPADPGKGFPEGFLKDLIVDTPEGLGVNPEATPEKCTVAQLSAIPPNCPLGSLVGTNYFTAFAGPTGPACTGAGCFQVRAALPVYNLVPFEGVPSMVGFPTSAPGEPTIIVGDLDPRDQHVRFTISNIHAPDGTAAHPPIVGSRLVFNGIAGDGTYLTMPSNCAGGQTSTLFVDAYGGASDDASFTTAVGADECETAPFEPTVDTSSGPTTDSPEAATVDVGMPKQLEDFQRGQSHMLKATVQLPEGAALNPAAGNGLAVCTDAQFKKGVEDRDAAGISTANPVECPAASRIGSVEVDTKALDQPLGGDVYVGQPLNNDPSSGDQFRIFLHAFNTRYGVNVRLIGHVFPNLQTGQLTVVVPENPQAPFNSFRVNIDGGPKGVLSSPFTCGPHTTTATFNSWSRPNEDVVDTSETSQTNAPGGGPCPKTLAERPFAPGFTAGTQNPKAGAYSALEMHIVRPPGDQELKRIDVTLPKGMAAKLRGVDYCPEDRIAAAAGSSGAGEVANPSCPASSLVGTISTRAGTGATPLQVGGKAYLAGPYKGAPISLVMVTPAVVGPYDVGTLVVRTALNVDPETAVVHAVSDPIPDVFGGVRLDVRSIDVSIDRQGYTVNPTSCDAQQFTGELYGGGGDPSNPDAWLKFTKNEPFQTTDCKALKFKPSFKAIILGGKNQTKRLAHPKFRAVFKTRSGDANTARAALVLPKATILDQGHIGTVCTKPRLAADTCPKRSVYGNAEATSPLLKGKLKGRVYLSPSGRELPDLVVDLKGQVPVRLRGVISSVNGKLKTVFPALPDAAVTKFVLTMKGGKKGLLVNSVPLCDRKRFSKLNLKAQNGRKLKKKKLKLNIKGCKGGKSKKK